MKKNKYRLVIYCLIGITISLFVGFVSSKITRQAIPNWYSNLNKPFFSPPNWIFAPVWTTLYLFMTIAIWAAWHKNYKNINLVLIYFIHLCFNTTWSIVFFVFHNILFALINLLVIIFFIIVLILKYKDINKMSYYLMIPYLLWSCYALILNFGLLILN